MMIYILYKYYFLVTNNNYDDFKFTSLYLIYK